VYSATRHFSPNCSLNIESSTSYSIVDEKKAMHIIVQPSFTQFAAAKRTSRFSSFVIDASERKMTLGHPAPMKLRASSPVRDSCTTARDRAFEDSWGYIWRPAAEPPSEMTRRLRMINELYELLASRMIVSLDKERRLTAF
jgi:hypothetical protein